MCRREIPPDYLDHPDLVQGPLEIAPEDGTNEHSTGHDLDEADDEGEALHDESR